MKPIPLPIAELKPALVGLGKIINKRTTLPVLNAVKIERTADGWISLTATDLDHFVTVRLEQPAAGEVATVLIPYGALVKIIKGCDRNDTITVWSQENASVWSGIISYPLAGQQVQHECETFPVEEFPLMPEVEGTPTALPDGVREALYDASECASTDETRYILNGVYLDVDQEAGHYVVATDGRQLYASNSFKLELPKSVVIPLHRFWQWKEFNRDGQWMLTLDGGKENVAPWLRIESRRWSFSTKLIEGAYPNWRQVLPDASKFCTAVKLNAEALPLLLQTIHRLPCHDAVNRYVGLELRAGKLSLLGRSSESAAWTKVEVAGANATGKDVLVALNRDLLARAWQFGLNTVEIVDAMTPVRLSHGGKQMVIMPIRPQIAANPPPQPEEEQPKTQQAEAEESPATVTERNQNMQSTQTPAAPIAATTEAQSTIATALEQIETIKGSYRQAIQGLNTLTDTLKAVYREQRTAEKEVQTVRATLSRLQSVRI